MSKRIAVISDATSAGFWFPYWHRYYGGAFGEKALYLVTYKDKKDQFANFQLGGVWEVPSDYSDEARPQIISALTSILLMSHDVVVRCDIDEYLIPDPRKFTSLKQYIENSNKHYVTALGINIFERESDKPFQEGLPILGQRQYGVLQSALHKTAITTVPIEWGGGFHGCSVYPSFDELYLLHAKLARLEVGIRWHEYMLNNSRETAYFSSGDLRLRGSHAAHTDKKLAPAWPTLDDPNIKRDFLDTIIYSRHPVKGDFYLGRFYAGKDAFEIPTEMHGFV